MANGTLTKLFNKFEQAISLSFQFFAEFSSQIKCWKSWKSYKILCGKHKSGDWEKLLISRLIGHSFDIKKIEGDADGANYVCLSHF